MIIFVKINATHISVRVINITVKALIQLGSAELSIYEPPLDWL